MLGCASWTTILLSAIVLTRPTLPLWSTDYAADHLHPIVELVQNAEKPSNKFMSSETPGLGAAVSVYHEKRGRCPSAGLKEGYIYAQENNYVLVEEFWDQIYHSVTGDGPITDAGALS